MLAPRACAAAALTLLLFQHRLPETSALATGASKPNIVFFMADDTGWYNVGWHNKDMLTPNSDQLIKDGIELDRHYAFVYCSPTRVSLMTGRLPYHAQQSNYPNCDLGQGAPPNMTFISTKLKTAGYRTAHFGKSHLGMARQEQAPKGRGFDEALIYFEGAEDHFTQRSCQDPECLVPIPDSSGSPYDFWATDEQSEGPAKDVAGKGYNGYIFMERAVQFIQSHDTADTGNGTQPLFLYMAPADAHSPLQAPQEFLDLYPQDWYLDRRQYAAMCSFWDASVGNITRALQDKGMWDNTLFVFSSDNGGPVYWSVEPSFPHGAGANNNPLKGGKISAWEGGVRVAAFVSGGLIPAKMRGTVMQQKLHVADWYATFAGLAGVDPTDHRAAASGLPPIDSEDIWPLLSGANTSEPHEYIPIVVNHEMRSGKGSVSALLMGNYKLLVGVQQMSYWQGPDFPNASGYGKLTDPSLRQECMPACLFDVFADPGEHNDLVNTMPAKVAQMQSKLAELAKTAYGNPSDMSQKAACQQQVEANGNFYGPFISGAGPPPAPPTPPTGTCGAELKKLGCLPAGPIRCVACAEEHRAAVGAACAKGEVKTACTAK